MKKCLSTIRNLLVSMLLVFSLASNSAKAGETESIIAHSADLTTTAIGLNHGLFDGR